MEVELRLPTDTQHVGLARLVVVTAARRAGMDEERVEDLRIAVSEATTNAILAQQGEDAGHRIGLRFGATDDGAFQVTISGAAPAVDDGSQPDAEPQARDWSLEGGLGVTLIRGLADRVEFVEDEGRRMQLRFTVDLQGPPAIADELGISQARNGGAH